MSANNPPDYDPDVDWIKTECLDNDNSTLPNRKLSKYEKRQLRKRKLEPLSSNNDAPLEDPKIKIYHLHQCDAASLFQVNSRDQLIKTLKKEANIANKNVPRKGSKSSPYKLQMNVVCDRIIGSARRNHIFKSTLPSDVSRPDPEKLNNPCIMKSYQWETDLNNPFVSKMSSEIKQMVSSVLIEPCDYKDELNKVISELNEAISIYGFSNRWDWYGSYLHGLVFADSTINLHYEHVPNTPKDALKVYQDIIQKLRSVLQGRKQFTDFISSSFVPFPWLSFYHVTSNKMVHITVSNDVHSGELRVRNSLLMKLYLEMNSDLKYLIGFVKLVMKKYEVHGTYTARKFESYTLFWLVVFFMQQKKLLPAVIDLRKAAKTNHHVAEWDCSLPDQYSYETEPVQLYSLLLGFFDYYKDFDFLRYVASPYVGRTILLSDFERLQIPTSEFSVYMRQLQNSRRLSFRKNVMNLQDPSDLACNIAKRILPEYVNQFKVVCNQLSGILPSSVEKMQKINCLCELFPYKIDYDNYFPHDLAQYCEVSLKTRMELDFDEHRLKKLNQIYVLEAIRKIMELVFKFKKKSIIITQSVVQILYDAEKETLVKQTCPNIYFEYHSTEKTWENDNPYMKEIFPQVDIEKEPVRIILTSEICLEAHFIKFLVQSNANFSKFLSLYLHRMLIFTLSQIVPV